MFYSADYRGEQVRVAALLHKVLDGRSQRPVLVQVAETIEARRQLSRRIMADAAAIQLALIAAAAALTAYGVRRSLAPLEGLHRLVAARADTDLTPIDGHAVPLEVAPLIAAINLHTARSKRLGDAQKRFIASASHQLKTPLTVLRAQAAHAVRLSDPAQLCAAVEQMHDATKSTSRLVEQLLLLARSEPGRALETEALDLAALARDVTLHLLALAREKDIDLGFEGEDSLTVHGERIMLREMVTNLVHNAIVYTPAHGRVHVRDDRARRGAEPVGASGGRRTDRLPRRPRRRRLARTGGPVDERSVRGGRTRRVPVWPRRGGHEDVGRGDGDRSRACRRRRRRRRVARRAAHGGRGRRCRARHGRGGRCAPFARYRHRRLHRR